ncbi:MAG: endonuclease/exonuclease/phosphatase family protein [Bdellovibrionota bacterium]
MTRICSWGTWVLIYFCIFLTSSAQFARAEGLVFRVLTLNIFAGKLEMDFERLERQIQAIRALELPDVIALQEVFDERVKERYREAFPEYELIDSGKSQPHSMTSYRLYLVAQGVLQTSNRAFGVAQWINGLREIFEGDTHGLTLLIKKQSGLVMPETKLVEKFEVQAAPTRPLKALESIKPKGFSMVELEIEGSRILLANTHLSNGVTNPRRIHQLKQIVKEIKRRDQARGFSCPAIFCGDTNADGKQPEMKWLHGEAGFIDSYVVANPDLEKAPHKGNTWDNKNALTQGNLKEPDQRVDYVSIRPGERHEVEVLSSKLVFDAKPVSDHYGVLTEFRILPKCERLLVRRER